MNIVDQQTSRDAVPCMGTAVNITITDSPAGRAGFTASAVCSVTDMPPTLLVCLSHGVSVWPAFSENRTLCVNTPSAGQEPPSNLLGGKTPMEHRSAAARWQAGAAGCSQLEEALVSFGRRISQVVSVGTHDILLCAIEAIHRHTTSYGLVWFDRDYHVLMRLAC